MLDDNEKKRRPAIEIAMEILDAMEAEFHHESDRIVAIVGAAYLDALLESLCRAVFIETGDEAERLLRPDAPLGSYGSRCQLAYCLGLVKKDQRDDLRTIAKIRNLFAHNYWALTFDL